MSNIKVYLKYFFKPLKLISVLKSLKLNRFHKGKNCYFDISATIIDSEVGNNVYMLGGNISSANIGNRTYFNENIQAKNFVIGNYCSVGSDVTIGVSLHPIDLISTHPCFYSNNKGFETFADKMYFKEETKLITIGNDVWLGSKATIMPGVTINDGAIVAYGSLVTKDVPPFAIVAGVPAKIIKYRFNDDVINELLRIKWWDWNDTFIKEHYKLFLDIPAFVNFFK